MENINITQDVAVAMSPLNDGVILKCNISICTRYNSSNGAVK